MRKTTSIGLIICLLLLSGIGSKLYSATMTSAQSGYFSVPSTWVGGAPPAYGDNIVISPGHTVTLDAPATVMNITIYPGAIFDNGIYSLTINNVNVGNPVYANNGVHNGTGNLVAYNGVNTEITGNGFTNCNIEIAGYGLSILNSCNLTINGNIQHSVPGNSGMNNKEFLSCWQVGSNLTVNGDIVTDENYSVGIIIVWGSTVTVNGNVSFGGGLDSGSGSTLTNFGTFNISGYLALGPFSGYCQNSGSMSIGGDLRGGGSGETYFLQEANSILTLGGCVFPDEYNGELLTSGLSILSGEPVEPNYVTYNAHAGQVIKQPSGGIPYSFLIVDNNSASGVTLNSDITINSRLSLNNGILTIGNFNLTMAETAAIDGNHSAGSMIVTSGSGELRKVFSYPGTFVFPVGDINGVAEYSPVTLSFESGSFSGAYAGVRLVNAAWPGTTGNYLNRYWNVTSAGITDFNCNALFEYVPADVNGSEDNLFCYQVEPSVTQFNPANTILHQISADGLTSFGTFTGTQQLVTDKALILNHVFLQGLYGTGGNMRQAMGDNGPQFDSGIADEIAIELHDPLDYNIIAQTFPGVMLDISGTAAISIPDGLIGSYYITIKHRSSIETVSAVPFSFAANTIICSFQNPQLVFGGNLFPMPEGAWVMYGGDVDQDGIVDTSDMTPIDNDASNYTSGYTSTDVNGDGIVDTGDMTIADNNASAYVSAITP